MLEVILSKEQFLEASPKILIIGVGGCGGAALRKLKLTNEDSCCEYLTINTDARALKRSVNPLQIGKQLTKGKGAGSIPEVGKQSAIESEADIKTAIEHADLIFLVFGMGSGTGTGAATEVARIAHKLEIPTLAIATRPFSFEGNKSIQESELCLARLEKYVTNKILIHNDQLSAVYGCKTSLIEVFDNCNQILANLINSLNLMTSSSGLINVDFNDFKTTLTAAGNTFFGIVKLKANDDFEQKIADVLDCPLTDDVNIKTPVTF